MNKTLRYSAIIFAGLTITTSSLSAESFIKQLGMKLFEFFGGKVDNGYTAAQRASIQTDVAPVITQTATQEFVAVANTTMQETIVPQVTETAVNAIVPAVTPNSIDSTIATYIANEDLGLNIDPLTPLTTMTPQSYIAMLINYIKSTRTGTWITENPKTALGITACIAAIAGVAYMYNKRIQSKKTK